MTARLFDVGDTCDKCTLKIFGACLEHEFGGCERHHKEHVASCIAHVQHRVVEIVGPMKVLGLTDPGNFERALAGAAAASQEQRRGDDEMTTRLLEVLQRDLGPATAADIREIRQDWKESRARVARLMDGTEPPP